MASSAVVAAEGEQAGAKAVMAALMDATAANVVIARLTASLDLPNVWFA